MTRPNQIFPWALILLFSAAAGALFNLFVTGNGRPMIGASFGIFIGIPMFAFMRGLLLSRLQQRVRRLPFPLYAPASLAIYILLIVLSAEIAGALLWLLGAIPEPFLAAIAVSKVDILYSLSVLAILMFMLRMKDLIGGEVLLNFLTGRYRKPVAEERIFLFVDIVGSTQFAERFGDLRAQEYLGHFFASLALPVRLYRGSIDDYVGDLAIISWPMRRGVEGARALRCVFAILAQIEREAQSWQAEFGMVPRFRAALHGGPVVTAEIGIDRRKIAYFGDTVNTTSRLEALRKTLDAPILISAELLARMPTLPANTRVTDLGSHGVRGRDRPLSVCSLAGSSER